HLLATIFFKIDVTLLEPLKGADVVAKYSVAYKWVDAIGVIPAFFTMALLPIMSRQAHDDKPGLLRNYQLAVKMLVMVALPVAVVTTFLAPTLIEVLAGSRYLPDGARALQLMIWFIPVGWINSLTQYVLIALDLQRPLKWPFVMGVIFNVSTNLLFIPMFSYQAASVVTILSEVVLQIGFYALLRPALGNVNWIKLLGRLALSGAAMFVVLALLWNVAPIVALAAAGVTYPVALIGLRTLNPDEVTRLAPLLPGPVRRLARV
ncbi:MAG: oligosaccharide flippase family protein, partial [Aggregatilineales bacterium]